MNQLKPAETLFYTGSCENVKSHVVVVIFRRSRYVLWEHETKCCIWKKVFLLHLKEVLTFCSNWNERISTLITLSSPVTNSLIDILSSHLSDVFLLQSHFISPGVACLCEHACACLLVCCEFIISPHILPVLVIRNIHNSWELRFAAEWLRQH